MAALGYEINLIFLVTPTTETSTSTRISFQFNRALLHSYVEQSGHLMWCCNPQGCDQVLCQGGGMNGGTCGKCQWSSCFSCHFTEVGSKETQKVAYAIKLQRIVLRTSLCAQYLEYERLLHLLSCNCMYIHINLKQSSDLILAQF